jgi:branched-chain amino acid transport system permease protein
MLQQAANALALGGIYGLVALAYNLTFGVLKVVNLAFGALIAVGAYAGLTAAESFRATFLVAASSGMVAAALFGVLVHAAAVVPLGRYWDARSDAHLGALVTTVGAGLVIQNGLQRLYGNQDLPYPPVLPTDYRGAASFSVSVAQVVVLMITTGLLACVWWALTRTHWGLYVRAATDNPAEAKALGIGVQRVKIQVVALSSALAGLAGVCIAVLDRGVTPTSGLTYGLKGLVCLIVAGTGNIVGAVAVAFLLAAIEILTVAAGFATVKDIAAYGSMLVILFVRPQGLFGHGPGRSHW